MSKARLPLVVGLLLAVAQPGAPAAGSAGRRAATKHAPARSVRPAPRPALVVAEPAAERDLRVAEACRSALGRANGGVVAMDPRTGRVVAVVNPALAVSRAYQPCSVFKIVVAIAGLSEGAITPESTFECKGGCWLWPGHGRIDLRRALAVSCNPYFQRVGEKVGYATVQRYAHLLGLGERSGVNLDGETPGRVPAFVHPSRVGYTSSHAAGVATSALQLGVLLSATINGGIVFRPRVGPAEGHVPEERWRLPAGTVLAGLSDGFLGAVNEGSASEAFDPDVIVAGKTGTCSGVGWFASYAPVEAPELVVVVFLKPGSGHLASAVAGRIYQQLYKGDPAPAVHAAP